MRTDNIVYQFFQENTNVFFRLLGKDPSVSENYSFRSITFKDAEKRMDGVMLPSNSQLPTIFIESQYYQDKSFYCRLSLGVHLY